MMLASGIILMASCHPSDVEESSSDTLIRITKAQFTAEKMELGRAEERMFEAVVRCDGFMAVAPDGMARVSAPVSGIIRKIHCRIGQMVPKGAPLFDISGNDFIAIQKEYGEAAAILKKLESEFKRAETLFKEGVGTEKEYITAQSDYQALKARYHGLRLQVVALGLSPASIENGTFYDHYQIKSPIQGYVTELQASLGSYAEPQTVLAEMINPDKFQLRLQVFPDDVQRLQPGQAVRFSQQPNPNDMHARLQHIGISVNDETKSVDCYASISGENHPVQNGYLQARIITGTDTVVAVPDEALVHEESAMYLLKLEREDDDGYLFSKVRVETGRKIQGYTELLGVSALDRILIKGAYNILLQ